MTDYPPTWEELLEKHRDIIRDVLEDHQFTDVEISRFIRDYEYAVKETQREIREAYEARSDFPVLTAKELNARAAELY